MNIQNIVSLADQLKSLGFADLAYSMAKRICFKPKSFCLSYIVDKGDCRLKFQLCFERDDTSDTYGLSFYDATFHKASGASETIAGVDVGKLSQQMAEVDWKKAFDFSEQKAVALTDKTAFDNELKIEAIVHELILLQGTQDGKVVAALLKASFWSGSAYHGVYGSISGPKNKVEISQRFYFMEGQPGISVEEAFRYLQNRWLEKEMLAKKKQPTEPDADMTGKEECSGLLRKRRTKKARNAKS